MVIERASASARRRIALGRGLRLAEARRRAQAARASIAKDKDPSEARRAFVARRKAAQAGVGTLGSVIAAYYDQGPGAALRSGVFARALIERVFVDQLQRSAVDIRPTEMQLLIDGWRSKSSGRHCAACFRPIMRWAAKRNLMAKGEALEAPTAGEKKQRALTRDEIRPLLRELNGHPHDNAARFMLLTGARREEVAEPLGEKSRTVFGSFQAHEGRTRAHTHGGPERITLFRCRVRRWRC